jgi:hypothetical protein
MGNKRSSIRHRARRDAVVAQLLERDGDRCWYCECCFGNGGRTLTLDHVEPLADGGRSKPGNLRLACRTCNRRKGSMGAEAYLTSRLLAHRRRLVAAEEARAAGMPKSAFSHLDLSWSGTWQWTCSHCGPACRTQPKPSAATTTPPKCEARGSTPKAPRSTSRPLPPNPSASPRLERTPK